MKLSKGRIRHLHKTKQQSRRNRAKTKEVARRHNLSHKNKTPVNLRSLTLKNAVRRPKHNKRNFNTFASRLDKRMAHYGVGGEPKKENETTKKEDDMKEAEEEKEEGDFGIDVSLLPWLILSKDKQMIIPTDSVLTVVEPIDAVTKLYLDKMESFKMEEADD